MTQEEARKAAEVMIAYAEGKEIEYRLRMPKNDDWSNGGEPIFNWDRSEYRIKKEPVYHPFKDKEECWNEMQKHQPFGWVINKNTKAYQSLLLLNEDLDSYKHLFQQLVFADGTPFGIKEE